jgi:hypothetical protein
MTDPSEYSEAKLKALCRERLGPVHTPDRFVQVASFSMAENFKVKNVTTSDC